MIGPLLKLSRFWQNFPELLPLMMRIREKLLSRLTKLWVDGLPVRQNAPGHKDFKEIALQQTLVEEKLTEDHVLLNIRQWHPNDKRLGTNEELAVLKTSSIGELKVLLSQLHAINAEDVRLVKPRPYLIKDTANIPGLDWFGQNVTDDTVIGSSPWSVRHGDIVLFKDNSIPEVRKSPSSSPSSVTFNPSAVKKPAYEPSGPTIYTPEQMKERAKRMEEEKKRKQEEEEIARQEAAERIRLGLGPVPKSAEETEEENRRAAEMEQARLEAIERVENFRRTQPKLV